MAWIELHQTVWTHRKTLLLGHALDLPPAYAAAHMLQLWCWALDNAPDGDLSGLPPAVIAAGAGWTGDPGQFVDAAVDAGFLDREDDCLLIHDWYDYAGKLIEKRQQDAERKRRARTTAKRRQDVQWTSIGQDADVAGNRTVPNPTSTDDDNAPARDESEASDPAKEECLALINRSRPDWVLSGERYREFLSYEDRLPWAVIRTAVDKTLAAGARDLKYCLRILEGYVEQRVQTVADVQALDAEFERRKLQRARDAPSTRRGRLPPSSNVILRREPKDDSYYEVVFKRFDDVDLPESSLGAAEKGADSA